MERNVLLWAFIPLILFEIILGCQPPADGEEPSLEEQIYNSDVVVYGNAKRRLIDPTYGHFPNAYMIEFEVFCSYKGGILPQLINITGAGKVPGLCFETNLEIEMSYIVLLDRQQNGLFKPTYADLEADIYLDEVIFICELVPEYPKGITESSAQEECLPIQSECISYIPATDATTTKEENGKDVKYNNENTDDEDDTQVGDVRAVGSGDDKDGATVQGLSLAMALICLAVTPLLV